MAEVTLQLIQTEMTLHNDGSVASIFIPESGTAFNWAAGIQSADVIEGIIDDQTARARENLLSKNITDAMLEEEYNELGFTLKESKNGTTYTTTR